MGANKRRCNSLGDTYLKVRRFNLESSFCFNVLTAPERGGKIYIFIYIPCIYITESLAKGLYRVSVQFLPQCKLQSFHDGNDSNCWKTTLGMASTLWPPMWNRIKQQKSVYEMTGNSGLITWAGERNTANSLASSLPPIRYNTVKDTGLWCSGWNLLIVGVGRD